MKKLQNAEKGILEQKLDSQKVGQHLEEENKKLNEIVEKLEAEKQAKFDDGNNKEFSDVQDFIY